ncbi:hypothetical protein N7454_000106 [Penicillium verhagenii]|nr:hypothetical protein N7454_000106 [Penicillium verhagenii]
MDDVQSTAKWANRVLRPLTSIYRRLEKHQETLAIIAAESRAFNHDKHSQEQHLQAPKPADPRESFGSDADEDDPGWIPGKSAGQRRVRHKYSGRKGNTGGRKRARFSLRSPETPRTLPGAIEVATPLITGKRWEVPSSARPQQQPWEEQIPKPDSRGNTQVFRDRYAQHKNPWREALNKCEDTGLVDIVHNLDYVLLNFLIKTDTSPRPKKGARSLLSMVTRHLPEFIATEQEAMEEEDEDGDEDVCHAYLTELESFYAPHGKGWKPLREIVRAQGLYMVCAMIRNRWLTDSIIFALIDGCPHLEQDASEQFLSTFLSNCTTCPLPMALKPTTESPSPGRSVALLHRYAMSSGNRSYMFNELSKLLVRGALPPEWMATKPWTGWMTRATISFSRHDGDYAVSSQLIEAVLVSACKVFPNGASKSPLKKPSTRHCVGQVRATRNSMAPASNLYVSRKCPVPVEDALSNHVASLIATLCGMHISRSRILDKIKDTGGTKAGHVINYVSFTVEKEVEHEPLSHISILPSHQLLRRGCILLARCLVLCNDAVLAGETGPVLVSTACTEEFSATLTSQSGVIKELAVFVRESFRCFSSPSNDDRDTDMRSEIRRVVSRLPSLTEDPGLSTFLSRVAVEAAMKFAEGTGDPDDHLWAVDIQEATMTLRHQTESSPGSASENEDSRPTSGLFRWEDGIGEWVARTPAIKANPTTITATKRRASGISNCSPCIRHSLEIGSRETGSDSDSPNQQIEVADSSPIRTRSFKRRRTTPMVTIERPRQSRSVSPFFESLSSESLSERSLSESPSRSPSIEPVRSHRRVLRDMSNHVISNPTRSVPLSRPASKVEVVIINKPNPRPTAMPALQYVEKRHPRSMDRRRSRQPSASSAPSPVVVVPRQQPAIPLLARGQRR